MLFRDYLKQKLTNEKIIEFGPLNRPLFNKDECDIKYADIRSTEEIKKLYSGNDYLNKTGITIDINTIIDVDYKIAEGSYVNTFKDEKFSVAYLSHVIEHMPDIIYFFNDIEKILTEDGKLAIIYPDKRYCFDHFRNSVSFRDAYATYKYGIKENARIAFDFSYNVVHENNPEIFWKGNELTKVISQNNLEDAERYYEDTINETISDGDVHFWPFSDIDFLKFIYEMKRANLFNYDVEEFYPTQENTQEFMIILKKSKNKDYTTILKLISEYDTQNKENNYKVGLENAKNEICDLKNLVNEKNRTIEEIKDSINRKDELIEKMQNTINRKDELIEKVEDAINKKDESIQRMQNFIISQMEKECNKNKQLQDKKDKKMNELMVIIKNYEQSKSWKITAPFRRISAFIRNIFKR